MCSASRMRIELHPTENQLWGGGLSAPCADSFMGIRRPLRMTIMFFLFQVYSHFQRNANIGEGDAMSLPRRCRTMIVTHYAIPPPSRDEGKVVHSAQRDLCQPPSVSVINHKTKNKKRKTVPWRSIGHVVTGVFYRARCQSTPTPRGVT